MSDVPSEDVEQIKKALSALFDPSEVRFKPAVVSGNRALALAYIDARVIQDRLDSVLGIEGWSDDYEFLADGSVVCRLRLKIGGEWITKVDVGGESEQPDGGDRRKAAVSDALKRAAVKFGIGRYLYRLPQQWCDYDAQRRQFTKTPLLPANALPPKPAPAGRDAMLKDLEEAAKKGYKAFLAEWNRHTPAERKSITQADLEHFKTITKAVDDKKAARKTSVKPAEVS